VVGVREAEVLVGALEPALLAREGDDVLGVERVVRLVERELADARLGSAMEKDSPVEA
jgi:hypothetical protein